MALSEHTYITRKMDVVAQVGRTLSSLPLPLEYRNVGYYYQSLCLGHRGEFDTARGSYEILLDRVPLSFRARVMMSMGGVALDSGDTESAYRCSIEAFKLASSRGSYDLLTLIRSQTMMAILNSLQGNHAGALADLENLFPMVHTASLKHPVLYYDHLNSLAVELGELGRIAEAQNASRIALACPFTSAYSEWRETSEELARREYKSPRSIAAINRRNIDSVGNLSLLPTGSERSGFTQTAGSARILNFADRGKNMPKEDNLKNKIAGMSLEEKQKMVVKLVLDIEEEETIDRVIETLLNTETGEGKK